MHFIDECIIKVKAGNGGNGVISWRREANVPLGGPYGGDGGDGGDVIIVGDHNINTLFEIRNKKIISAMNGTNGRTAKEHGKNGETTYIHVPLGTEIFNAATNELIVDITKDGQQHIIAEGGKGGRGNAFFKSSFNRAPSIYEHGDIGEEKNIHLKLRFLADVGIVGFPNVGKSTFISKIANVKPKIASYQFTTLVPVLGLVTYNNERMVFSDMPGLIEGASKGKGLGHDFLKHIERCSMLIHMVSLDKTETPDPILSYEIITNELKEFSSALLDKPIILVASKCDAKGASAQLRKLKQSIKHTRIFVISAKDKIGIDELLAYIFNMHKRLLDNIKKNQKDNNTSKIIELPKEISMHLKITKQDGVWVVDSEYMRYWTNRIPLTTKDNILRYNQKMQTIGVEQEAKKMGAKAGDTLIIYTNTLVID